ncbi:MetS family NSS transporter small subunit [bacterium]|nr:MetS family NSS transporter small subunit [bacterium]
MPISAWIMFGFGCIVLYGGLTVCIHMAYHHRNKMIDKDNQ